VIKMVEYDVEGLFGRSLTDNNVSDESFLEYSSKGDGEKSRGRQTPERERLPEENDGDALKEILALFDIPFGSWMLKKTFYSDTHIDGWNPEEDGYIVTDSKLGKVKRILISATKLKTIPEAIQRIPHLEWLELRGNKITHIPKWILSLSKLKRLDFSYNKITEFPEWLADLPEIETLELAHCNIKKIPRWLLKFTFLQHLDVSHNKITEVPDWIVDIPYLKHLDISHNAITDLPPHMNRLIFLNYFDFSNNKISEIPEDIRSETIEFDFNRFYFPPDSIDDGSSSKNYTPRRI